MPVTKADQNDIPALVPLINSAYRGEASKKGWTTEADMLEGDLRTDTPTLTALMQQPGAVILKYYNDTGSILGSVYLHKQDRGLYLGMLTVDPTQQAAGIGKQLMRAAEQYAKEQNCPAIFMNVISIRHELIAWYEKLGYQKTGEVKPFPNDPKFGIPKQPLEFHIMEKMVS
jgi:ribosomal protein S18 acetylase RimI-like enzyme